MICLTRVPFPNLRRGIDYGFDADELARIKDEFPGVEVCWNVDSEAMELWSQGDSGQWLRYIACIPRDDVYQLHDQLREMRANASRYKAGVYGQIERNRLDAIERASVDEAVNEVNPDLVRYEAKKQLGYVSPVSMAQPQA